MLIFCKRVVYKKVLQANVSKIVIYLRKGKTENNILAFTFELIYEKYPPADMQKIHYVISKSFIGSMRI